MEDKVVVKKRATRKKVSDAVEVVKKAVTRKPRVKKVGIEEVATILAPPPPPPRDFTEAKKKWDLGDIDNMVYKPRTEFVQGLLGSIGGGTVEDTIVRGATPGKLAEELRELGKQYIVLRDKNARLPKFSKWLTSMFVDRQDLHVVLAKEAQGASGKEIRISGDIVDLLRVADTKHYWSCLSASGTFREVPRYIVEKCNGIFIAYIDGDDDKMKGRIFLNHGRTANGEDVVFSAGQMFGNGFTLTQLADYFADLGVRFFHYTGGYGGGRYGYTQGGNEVLTAVECFGKDLSHIHYDTPTWAPLTCTEVKPSSKLKKVA